MNKNIVLCFAMMVALFACFGCDNQTVTESPVGLQLSGIHEIVPLTIFDSVFNNSNDKTNYFIKSPQGLTFAWKNKQGEIILSTLPWSKIRMSYSSSETPNIKFKWTRGENASNMESVMKDNVVYAVISVKEESWAPKLEK